MFVLLAEEPGLPKEVCQSQRSAGISPIQSRPASRLLHKLCTSGACGNIPLMPIMAMGSVAAGASCSDTCMRERAMRERHLETELPDGTSSVITSPDVRSFRVTARG